MRMLTTIGVHCNDQQLSVVSKPIVAAGGRNENEIEFTFCSMWDGYTKTAVFWADNSGPFRVLIDGENKCLVPAEVTVKEGKFYFGVFGVSGDSTKTSTVITYDIKKGVSDEGQEPDPTASVYEQILAELAATQQSQADIVNSVRQAQAAAEEAAANAEAAATAASSAIPSSEKGIAGGVASLDNDGKVPSEQLPSMDYIPTSEKGAANGVASLDNDGKVLSGQLNLSSSVTSASTTTAANSYAVKQAYDKASDAGDAAFGSGTILTGTSSSDPSSVTSSSVRYKKINGVTYVRVSAKCNFNNPSGCITLRISLTGLSVQYSDCMIGQLNQFIVGSTIFDNNIKLVMVSNSGSNLVFDIYYENISITSDKTVSVECSAILTRPT